MTDRQTQTNGGGSAIVLRDNAGNEMMEVRSDLSIAAVAAHAEAMVKSKFALAQYRPRDLETMRVRLLKDCQRPGFAAKAIYKRPQGKKKVGDKWVENFTEGASIRFAEACFRHAGNLMCDAWVVAEDSEKRVVAVSVCDLETNATDSQQAVVLKRVERKADKSGNPPLDRRVLDERQNTYGEKLFIVEATEDEMLQKTNSILSRIRRNRILALCPTDIVEEALDACRETTLKADKAQDPDTAKRKMIDAFATVGVVPADLRAYLGHDLDVLQPAELNELRGLHVAMKEGETTWREVMASKTGINPETGEVKAPPPKSETGAAMEALRTAGSPALPPTDVVPAINTDLFAEYLLSKIRAAKTLAELELLHPDKMIGTPAGRKEQVNKTFVERHRELRGAK